MMLKHNQKLFLMLTIFAIAALACGGGTDVERQTPSAEGGGVSSTVVPSGQAPSPTATVLSQAAVSQETTGTILDRALIVPPYELENIRYGGTLRMTLNIATPHFDPKLNNQSVLKSGRYFYEKLVGWEPNPDDDRSHLAPILAESWDVSGDLKVYTFKLRKGIKWQNVPPVNGRELIADDAVFSLNRYKEKDSITFSAYNQVESIKALDKYTVEMRLKEPNAWALNDLFPATDYVVAPEVVRDGGGTIPLNVGVGTGAYILKKYVFLQGGTYVRNPDYWRKDAKGNPLPYTDEIELIVMADQATINAAFRTGQIDYSQMPTRDVIELGKSIPTLRAYSTGVSSPGNSLAFNTRKAPWDDVRVRRGVSMLYDREKYAQLVMITPFWQYNGPIPWFLVSDEPFGVEKLGPYYRYNPQEGRRLLIEAGIPGGKLKIPGEMLFAHPSMAVASQVHQELLKREGIELTIKPADFSVYGPYYYQRTNLDIALTFQNGSDFTINWYAQNKFTALAPQNTSYINDPEVERVVKEIKLTQDPAKLRQFAQFLWDFDTSGIYTMWMPSERGYNLGVARLRNNTIRSGDTFMSSEWFPWLADAPRSSS